MNIATIIICSIGSIAGLVMTIKFLVKENFWMYILFCLMTVVNVTAVIVSANKINRTDQNDIIKENTYYQVVNTKTLVTPTDTVIVYSDTTYLRK